MRLNTSGRILAVLKTHALATTLALAVLVGAVAFGAEVVYEYDDLGRLKSATYDDGKQIEYGLDPAGNRLNVKTWHAPPAPVINDQVVWNNTGNFGVTWAAPTTAVSITHYELFESLDGAAYSTTPLVNTLVLTYSATGRAQGSYRYRVRACNVEGCGRFATWNNPVNVDLTPPSSITGFLGTPLSSTTARLSWNLSTDNFGISAYQYRLVPSQTWISAGTALSVDVTGLTPQTDYTAQIRAIDYAANPTAVSSAAFATLRPLPSAPTNLATNQVADCAWRATWTSPGGATSFIVRDTVGVERTVTDSEIIINCPVGQPEQLKPYWVRACNADGCSARAYFGVNDVSPPTQPGVLIFNNILHNGVTLSWAASSDDIGVTEYDYRVNGGSWITVGGPTATITGLSAATLYNIDVRAVDAAGKYSPTRSGNFTTLTSADTTPPSAPPTAWVSDIQAYQVTVNWAAATDNIGVTGYRFKPTIFATWTTVGNVIIGTQTALQASTSYVIEVQARDATGNWSTSQQTASFTTAIGIPPAPTGLAMNHVADCAWSASWNLVGTATSYIVRDTQGTEYPTNSTNQSVNCPIGQPEANKPRYVRACNASGCSANAEFEPGPNPDSTPPSQPGVLVFSGVTGSTATVTWAAATDNVGVTSYEYQLNSGSWIVIGLSTSVNLTGLSGGTAYTVGVRARDAAGNVGSVRSNTFNTTDGSAPTQPGTVTFTSVTATTATATWGASTDNIAVTGYEYRLNAGTWNSLGVVTSVGLTGLSGSTSYAFEVRARDAAGNFSTVRSATLVTTDTTAPSQPGTVTISLITATTARATWGASTDNIAVAGYDYRLNNGTWTNAGNVTVFDLTSLAPLTSYTFEVRARDAAGNTSTVRTASAFTTLDGGAPTQPGTVTISAITGSTATATWGASTDNVAVTGYDYRLNGGTWTGLGNVISVGLTGLSQATSYTFEVRARDAAGNISAVRAAPAFLTLDATAPSQPGALTITPASFSAAVTWGLSTDNVAVAGYDYRLSTAPTWTSAGTGLSTTVFSLAASTSYTFEVRARDAAGNLSSVRSSSFTTLVAPPPAPTGLTYNHVADCAWSASWNSVSGATSYLVRDTQGTEYPTTSTSQSINCPIGQPETNKPRWVKACNAGGCGTQADFAATGGDPVQPTQPGAMTFSNITGTSVTATWGASTDNIGVTFYEYQVNSGSWTSVGLALSANITGLSGSTSYTIGVRARDAASNFSLTRTNTFTTSDVSAPTQPGTVTFTSVTATTATANWGASTDNLAVTGYEYRLNGGGWNALGVVTSVGLTGLSGSTSYTFEVRARDAAANYSIVRSGTLATSDITAPSQPGVVSISLVAASSARATWGASTDNIAVVAYDYRLNGGSWVNVGNVTVFDITGLAEATTYTVEVRARDAAGNPSATRAASPFVTLDGTAPSQPGTVTISSVSGTTATATWGAATDNVAVTAYDYRLNGGGWVNVGNVLTVGITGLAQGTNYTVEVRARDGAGNGGTPRAASTFTTLDQAPPSAPSSLTFSSVGAFSALAEWGIATDNIAVGAYQYRLTTQAQWTETGLTRSAFLTGLAPQTSYTVEVRARDNALNIGPIISNSFTTGIAPPAAPTGLSYNHVADCAWSASWSSVSGATSYLVRDTNGSEYPTTSTSQSINCPIGNPEANKPRWVKACNGGGCSGEANFGSTGGDAMPPSTPPGIQATNVQPTTATISWGASSDNVGVAGYQYAVNSGGWNGVSVTSVGITGLLDNASHTVYVRAYDGAGNFSGTTQVTFSTPTAPDITPPGAPPNLRVGSPGSSSTRLDWDAASDNLAVAGYNYRFTTSGTWTIGTTALSATMGVSGSTNYTFEVRARDSAGNLGAISSLNFTTPAGIPNAPANAWATQGSMCHWNTWWDPPASGSAPTYYRIREQGTGNEFTATSQPASVSFPPCDDPSSNRPQWVKACNAQGCSVSRPVTIQ